MNVEDGVPDRIVDTRIRESTGVLEMYTATQYTLHNNILCVTILWWPEKADVPRIAAGLSVN